MKEGFVPKTGNVYPLLREKRDIQNYRYLNKWTVKK